MAMSGDNVNASPPPSQPGILLLEEALRTLHGAGGDDSVAELVAEVGRIVDPGSVLPFRALLAHCRRYRYHLRVLCHASQDCCADSANKLLSMVERAEGTNEKSAAVGVLSVEQNCVCVVARSCFFRVRDFAVPGSEEVLPRDAAARWLSDKCEQFVASAELASTEESCKVDLFVIGKAAPSPMEEQRNGGWLDGLRADMDALLWAGKMQSLVQETASLRREIEGLPTVEAENALRAHLADLERAHQRLSRRAAELRERTAERSRGPTSRKDGSLLSAASSWIREVAQGVAGKAKARDSDGQSCARIRHADDPLRAEVPTESSIQGAQAQRLARQARSLQAVLHSLCAANERALAAAEEERRFLETTVEEIESANAKCAGAQKDHGSQAALRYSMDYENCSVRDATELYSAGNRAHAFNGRAAEADTASDLLRQGESSSAHSSHAESSARRCSVSRSARFDVVDAGDSLLALLNANVQQLDGAERQRVCAEDALRHQQRSDDEDFARQLQQDERDRAAREEADAALAAQFADAYKTFRCEICFDDRPIDEVFIVRSCGHRYCRECASAGFGRDIAENRLPVICPGCRPQSIDTIVSDAELSLVLGEEKMREYLTRSLQSAAMKGEGIAPCPQTDCGGFGARSAPGEAIECNKCGYQFCFECGSVEYHAGSTCEQYQQWRRENAAGDDLLEDEAQRRGWPKCPHCQVYVGKEEGCNKVQCRCQRFSFCALCSADLSHMRDPYVHFNQRGSPCYNRLFE